MEKTIDMQTSGKKNDIKKKKGVGGDRKFSPYAYWKLKINSNKA